MKRNKRPRRSLDFADVREIALSMPEAEEATAYGMPSFKAGKKRFAGQPIPRADIEPNTLGVAVSLEERARLVAERPDVYYLTEHYRNYPGVLVRLSNVTRAELRQILTAAWHYAMQHTPPKKKRATRRR